MKKNIYKKKVDNTRVSRITNQWINLYQEYYEFDNRVIELIEYKNGTFYMESVTGTALRDLDYNTLSSDEKRFIFNEVVDIWTNHVNFKGSELTPNELFVHDDYHVGNLFYTGDSVRLLDPDSFWVYDLNNHINGYIGKFLDSFISMQKIWS